ncbi:hypothetical protein PRZ48_012981 [Zasmidium cellare]|uniref:Uncharacterized protein n=1 Tax=Zasmidium cellare TaxID=395010 RepID=A0ABR0E398_ZASCE|nr:hypothetical protein PRZ48_012981 [Zasmidium cellare]
MHTPTTAFLFMISTVTALPPPVMHNRPLAEHVNRGAQSCIGTQKQFDQLFYESRIGQVYAKSKCEELEDRLDHAGVLATDVRCVKDEDGFTFVSFVSYWNYGAIFNGVLGSVFTEINGCKTLSNELMGCEAAQGADRFRSQLPEPLTKRTWYLDTIEPPLVTSERPVGICS